jgi:hypothetical protein
LVGMSVVDSFGGKVYRTKKTIKGSV